MTDADPERLARLELRVAHLETRLAAMEPVAAPMIPVTVVAPPPIPWPARPTAQSIVASPAVTVTSPPAATPPAPARSRSFADLEEQLSSRLLAWVGGIALVLGAMFFLSLAFSRGWIGPELRVLIGLVAGAGALFAGAWVFERGDRTPAAVLTGVGVGTGSLALFAASRLYGFIPIEAALAGFLVIAVTTAAIALRANAQAVAAFGLIATTMAPPILGASPNLVTVAFLGIALVGTALISFRRSWPWLAVIAFVATAPQAARWVVGEPSTTLALAGLFTFWTINALAASGRALAGSVRAIHRATATLLVLDTLFAITWIHRVLAGDESALVRSISLLILAGALGALALELLLRTPRRHPFGILLAGLSAGTIAIGIALEVGGIARPIGHIALAVVVACVAIWFRDRSAAAWSAAIGSLAVIDFLFVQYPLEWFERTRPAGVPFASPEGIVAIALAGGLVLVAVFAWRSFTASPLRDQRWTANLALAAGVAGAIAVIAWAADFELVADLRVVAWAILAALEFVVAAFVHRDRLAWPTAATTGATILAIGGWVAFSVVAPPNRLLVDPDRGGAIVPLLNGETLALAALAGSLGVAAWAIAGSRLGPWSRPRPIDRDAARVAAGTLAAAGGVLVYLVSIAIVDGFQARIVSAASAGEIATQAQVALSIAWVLIGAGAFAVGLVRRVSLARLFGLGLLSLATIKVFLFDLSSLDVAYRVLSFIGLGAVLLASSFVAARFRAPAGRQLGATEPNS